MLSIQVHCYLKEKGKQSFLPGMFVNALIEKAAREVVELPIKAILKEGDEYSAFQIKEDLVVKTILQNAIIKEDFIVFDNPKEELWVIEGAYYVE